MASFTYLCGGCVCSREKCSADCATYRSYMPKPVTNADRIRAMTDAELASFFKDMWNGCPPGKNCPKERIGCGNCWLEWLKKEADNG